MPGPPSLTVPPGLTTCRALLAYDGQVRTEVVGLKNRDERGRVTRFAHGLAELVVPEPGLVVTWVPTSEARRRERGFDQAELLARAVARRRRLPVRSLLLRRPGAVQAGLHAAERWRHPGFRTRARVPAAVLVIDDVTTTGASLAAAADALRGAGAAVVHGLVLARAARPGAV